MSRYSNRNRDPRWIIARYNGTCSQCGSAIRKGHEAFYYPHSKSILCGGACGNNGEAAMRAERSMDQYGTDCALDY